MKKGILVILFLGLYVSSAFAGYSLNLTNGNVLAWESCQSYDSASFFGAPPDEDGKLFCGAFLVWDKTSGYIHGGEMCIPKRHVKSMKEVEYATSGGGENKVAENSSVSTNSEEAKAEEVCRSGVMGMSIGGAVVTEVTKVRVANSAIPIFNLFVNVERGGTPPGIKLMPHVISCAVHKSKSSGDWITTFKVVD